MRFQINIRSNFFKISSVLAILITATVAVFGQDGYESPVLDDDAVYPTAAPTAIPAAIPQNGPSAGQYNPYSSNPYINSSSPAPQNTPGAAVRTISSGKHASGGTPADVSTASVKPAKKPWWKFWGKAEPSEPESIPNIQNDQQDRSYYTPKQFESATPKAQPADSFTAAAPDGQLSDTSDYTLVKVNPVDQKANSAETSDEIAVPASFPPPAVPVSSSDTPRAEHSPDYVPLIAPNSQPNASPSANSATFVSPAPADQQSENPGDMSSLPDMPALPQMPSTSGNPQNYSNSMPVSAESAAPETAIPNNPVGRSMQDLPALIANNSDESAQIYSADPDNVNWRDQMKASHLPGTKQTYNNYTGAKIWAKIGNDVILESDINSAIAKRVGKIRREAIKKGKPVPSDTELEGQIKFWQKEIMTELVQTKIIFQDAGTFIPPENMTTVRVNCDKVFNDKQIPEMLKEYGVSSQWELEKALKSEGSSLDRERKQFFEQSIGMQWLQMQTEEAKDIRHEEILKYYNEHAEQYTIRPKARWEEIVVYKNRFSSREQAYTAIRNMGQEVSSGKPFAEVAKSGSQGFTASDGGERDWITPGSLKSEQLDKAIFSQQVGNLSPQIIEDDTCFYIIRVIERNAGGKVPFEKAQLEIRTILKTIQRDRSREKAFKKIMENATVWTIYDGKSMN